LEVDKTALFDFGIEIDRINENFLVGPLADTSVNHAFMGHFSYITVVYLPSVRALVIVKMKQISHNGSFINHRGHFVRFTLLLDQLIIWLHQFTRVFVCS